MTEVVIYTDGACSGNPGPGGWGVVLRWQDTEKELYGGDPQTTNNRMELMAAIQALETLRGPATVNLHTDSKYLLDRTTNNRRERMAAIQALETLRGPATVNLHTDSKYLLDGITKWIKGWERNGWMTSAKKPVKNADLWRRLTAAMSRHEVTG